MCFFIKNHLNEGIKALFKNEFLNLPGCLKGWKFERICILCYPIGFWHWPFYPSPFKYYKTKNEIKITNLQHSHIVWAIWKSLLLWNVVFGSLIGGGGEQVGKAPNALLQCSVPILIFLPEIYRKIVVTVIYMA